MIQAKGQRCRERAPNQEPHGGYQEVSERNAASYVSRKIQEREREMLLTLTVGLERIRRNSKRMKRKMEEGEGWGYYSAGEGWKTEETYYVLEGKKKEDRE